MAAITTTTKGFLAAARARKKLRLGGKFSQEDVTYALKQRGGTTSLSTYQSWEKDASSVKVSDLLALSEILEATLDELLVTGPVEFSTDSGPPSDALPVPRQSGGEHDRRSGVRRGKGARGERRPQGPRQPPSQDEEQP